MAVTSDRPGPYAPPSAILDLIARYRDRGLPMPLTKDVLARAGVAETLIPRVLQSLQTLDLIDDKGQPTPAFEGIRRAPAAEYQQRLAEWLNATYADALNFIDPATADEVAIRDAFRNYDPVGQQSRMVSLFMGLYAAAGIGGERSTSKSRPAARANAVPRQRQAPKPTNPVRKPEKIPGIATIPPALGGLLESLPDPEKGWTQERRDKFYKTFGTILDFCFPIVANGVTDESEGNEG